MEALETVYRRETSNKHLSAFGQGRNAEDQARVVALSSAYWFLAVYGYLLMVKVEAE